MGRAMSFNDNHSKAIIDIVFKKTEYVLFSDIDDRRVYFYIQNDKPRRCYSYTQEEWNERWGQAKKRVGGWFMDLVSDQRFKANKIRSREAADRLLALNVFGEREEMPLPNTRG